MNENITLHTTSMPQAVYLELIEALDELDSAFGGRPTAESVNARNWLLDATKTQMVGIPATGASNAV